MRKLIPFSNGTGAMIWMDNNCDQCKRSGCYPKRAIEMGYITGTITNKVAEFIGCQERDTGFCTLNSRCVHFNEPNKRKHIEDKRQLNIF
jgi:hypothetical protein